MSDDPWLHQPITTRDEALGVLRALWDADTDIGSRILVDVVARLSYALALTDEALIEVARAQQAEDMLIGLKASRP